MMLLAGPLGPAPLWVLFEQLSRSRSILYKRSALLTLPRRNRNWYPWQDLHPQPPVSKTGASASWATWALLEKFGLDVLRFDGSAALRVNLRFICLASLGSKTGVSVSWATWPLN